MIDILLNTPLYVYWMFFSLLVVGLMQKKSRTISTVRALSIPSILIVLSFLGFIVDFKISVLSLFFYFFGFIISILLLIFLQKNYKIFSSIIYLKESKQFTIKGSYYPLSLFMFAFFTKYFVSFIKEFDTLLFQNSIFIGIFCFLYGMFLGIFISRVYILVKTRNKKF